MQNQYTYYITPFCARHRFTMLECLIGDSVDFVVSNTICWSHSGLKLRRTIWFFSKGQRIIINTNLRSWHLDVLLLYGISKLGRAKTWVWRGLLYVIMVEVFPAWGSTVNLKPLYFTFQYTAETAKLLPKNVWNCSEI